MKRDENCYKDDIAEIEKLRKTDIEASLKGDTDTLLSLMTDDIVLIYPDQPPVKGIETIRKRMEAYKKELENITIKQTAFNLMSSSLRVVLHANGVLSIINITSKMREKRTKKKAG